MNAQQVSDALLRIHNASDHAQEYFRPVTLGILSELLHFDSAVWASGTHKPHRLNSVYLHRQPQALITLYEKEFLFKQDFVRAEAVRQPGKAARLSELKTRAEYEAMLTYKILCRPLGIEQAMAVAHINQHNGLYDYIALWRKDPQAAFSAEDAQLLELLFPHLYLGEQRWLQKNLAHSSASNHVLSRAMFDPHGVLQVADESISEHFNASWPGWIGPQVPQAILQAAMRSKKMEAAHSFSMPDRRHYEVRPYLCSHMGPAFKLSVAHDPSLSVLSPREAEVAAMYAKGLSHKEIAVNLGSAPTTVRNQCMAVLRKLGLRNKAELANQMKVQQTP
jgi:DNA-binding CsgD family transcriptional regulator